MTGEHKVKAFESELRQIRMRRTQTMICIAVMANRYSHGPRLGPNYPTTCAGAVGNQPWKQTSKLLSEQDAAFEREIQQHLR